MRRTFIAATCLAFVGMLFTVPPALAQNPHFITGPTATCGGTDNLCLEVNFKVSGLGNQTDTVNFSLNCASATVTGQCFTRSGNPVQGTTKSGTVTVNANGTLPVRNGTARGPIEACAPTPANLASNPGCTGSQTFEIQSVSYSDCTLDVGGATATLSQTCPT
jgi:hypothetical protein